MGSISDNELVLLEYIPSNYNYIFRENGYLFLTYTKDGTVNGNKVTDFPYAHMFSNIKEGMGLYISDIPIVDGGYALTYGKEKRDENELGRYLTKFGV